MIWLIFLMLDRLPDVTLKRFVSSPRIEPGISLSFQCVNHYNVQYPREVISLHSEQLEHNLKIDFSSLVQMRSDRLTVLCFILGDRTV